LVESGEKQADDDYDQRVSGGRHQEKQGGGFNQGGLPEEMPEGRFIQFNALLKPWLPLPDNLAKQGNRKT